ncbi:MAG: iron-containing alcohol dehydrogenase [Zavarzinella sp.]
MRTVYQFASAGQLIFGNNSLLQLNEVIQQLGIRKIMLITDPILEQIGMSKKVISATGTKVLSFTESEPEPSLSMVRKAAELAIKEQPDALIALGGGSNIDATKLVGIILQHGGDPRDYVGEHRVPGPIVPLIAIPTTAGTGSEVSQAAVFTDTERQLKVSCLSPYLRPKIAIVDPLLTYSCPPKVTADSGIDALTHAIEAYTAIDNADYPLPPNERSTYQGKNPIADMYAEKTIHLVSHYLVRAYRDPNDAEAREGMALAATMGGLAFSNAGVALVHAMEYPVGAAVHVSHGAGNGLLLPYIMQYNLPVRQQAFQKIAGLMGVSGVGKDGVSAALRAIDAVRELRKAIDIPERLRDLGVKQSQLAEFAVKAHSFTRLMRVNPQFPTVAEIEQIYQAAW